MWVVKLGGSLDAAGRLGDWARALAATPPSLRQPLLVVPGGGPFAHAVRAANSGGSSMIVPLT
jgi:dihydroneopterin aldolase